MRDTNKTARNIREKKEGITKESNEETNERKRKRKHMKVKVGGYCQFSVSRVRVRVRGGGQRDLGWVATWRLWLL